jgi:pentatricopeptide repeat protein
VGAVLAPLVALRALICALRGRFDEALGVLDESDRRGCRIDVSARQAVRLAWLGHVYLLAGQAERALELTRTALNHARIHEERGHEAEALWRLGQILHRRPIPDLAEAEVSYQAALELAQELEFRPLIAHCHADLSTLYRRTHRHTESETRARTAASMYREMNMTYWLQKAQRDIEEA